MKRVSANESSEDQNVLLFSACLKSSLPLDSVAYESFTQLIKFGTNSSCRQQTNCCKI